MANAVTVERMRQYLEQFGWHKYEVVDEPLEQEGLIVTGWRSNPVDDGYRLIIDPMVERGCLSFYVPNLMSVPMDSIPEAQLRNLMLTIAFLNYSIILGKFSYDPRDGEVRFAVTMPIDENDFTYAQFVHTIGVLIKTVETYAYLLDAVRNGEMDAQAVIETVTEGPRRQLRDALERLLEDLRRALDDDEN